MKVKLVILAILFITSGIFYYNLTGAETSGINKKIENAVVSRVIDGDTVKLEDGRTIRLLGINTPEKSMPFSEEATELLNQMVQGKSVKIESYGLDKYDRTLAYLFVENKSVNKEILVKGLATLYFYDKDDYYNEFEWAEKFARLSELGLWKKSSDEECITMTQLKSSEPEKLMLRNWCDKDLIIFFKDDASHIYNTTIEPNSEFTEEFSHIWNDDGDALHVWDRDGLLLFYRY